MLKIFLCKLLIFVTYECNCLTFSFFLPNAQRTGEGALAPESVLRCWLNFIAKLNWFKAFENNKTKISNRAKKEALNK